MIPIKDAITIFEQHKINYLRDNNPKLTNERQFGMTEQIFFLDTMAAGKCLLSFVKKKHITNIDGVNYINNENIIFGDIQLYGKEYQREMNRLTDNLRESSRLTDNLLDPLYEKIYPKWYVIDPDIDPNDLSYNDSYAEYLKKSETVYNLYENYDYHSIYNPSTNYTVMKDNHTGTITYVDISVNNNEFKQFLEKMFISSDEENLERKIFTIY